MTKLDKTTILMILDGYGINNNIKGNAVALANTPYLDNLFSKYSNATIGASGEDVGLPDGQMGNSEVGHMNIGAGRIVYQDLSRITKEIKSGNFFENRILLETIAHIKKNNGSLHIMGLVSDGGVHSHIDHLKAIIDMAKRNDVKNVYIHCFLDGRDVPPMSASKYILEIEQFIKKIKLGKIATISGRYYAMDRDNRWDRIEKAYRAIVEGKGRVASSAQEGIRIAYKEGEKDEFVLPTVVERKGRVEPGDGVIMFNFRPDRARELTKAITDEKFSEFNAEKITNISYVSMTQYDASFKNVNVAYSQKKLKNTLGEYVSKKGMRQLRIAETEKYAHVTFFFNGGIEKPNENEDRILINSPKVATYDLKPEMSAYEVTEKTLEVIGSYDLIILNFANADMVGHTGDIKATIKAIETLDKCIKRIVEKIIKIDGQILMTADHGNADVMLDENSNIVTAHSLNRVPLLHISNNALSFRNDGRLADVAPTLLELMHLEIPDEMTGKSLIKK